MGNYWIKIKIWTKGILFGLMALYMLIFFLKNDVPVKIWYWPFKEKYEISVIWLTVIVLAVGVVGTILLRTTFKTIRQFREMRAQNRLDRIEREHAEMKAKAAMLQTRTSMASSSQVSNAIDEKSADGE